MGSEGEADVISRISPTVRGRCRILLSRGPAFFCPAIAVERLSLRVGIELTSELRERIDEIARQSKCRACALRILAARDHSRAELAAKLNRRFEPDVVQSVIDDLIRRNVLNDANFAKAKAESSARHAHHGPARVLADLQRSGVSADIAADAVRETYAPDNRLAVALDLARRQLPRLKKLPPKNARQRLAGMLARRGFDEDDVRSVIEKMLGAIED
jgi:regulatory protein